MTYRPPKNDRQRLQNLIEALAEPGDGDDAFDEEMHAELARRGLTLETWGAQIRAQAQAVLDENRARRKQALQQPAPTPTGNAPAKSTSRKPLLRSVSPAKVAPPRRG
jgi:hypothetical protein